jgi:GTP-binding protein HflX
MNETMNNELEKAVLVAVNSGDTELFNYQLEELKNLCEACQVKVVGTITQRLTSTHPAFYVNRGKLDEIKNMVNATDAEVVIFNDELSPSQIGNIEEIVETRIIDRTMLILDIFDRRARTKEAQLQVAIATARYMMPRLIGSRKYLSRLGGGGGGTAGARRGAGETKLELDRRHLGEQIVKMKTELEELVKSRETSRKMRQDKQIPVVALVGYTNSGKSSTLNAIMQFVQNENEEKNVYVEDMLFATLETATRRIKLPSNKEFLLTDTVGFVSKLPHHLVESFKSTLEEIKEASLIIHIADASSPFLDLQVKTTREVLAELGVENVKTLYAFNKIDLAKDFIIPAEYADALKVSAKTLEGYPELVNWIEKELFGDYKEYTLNIPYAKGDIFSYLKENTEVLTTEYQEQFIKVTTRLSTKLANLYREYIA